jgi:hypothetical protein
MGVVWSTYVKAVRRYVAARGSQANVDSECVKIIGGGVDGGVEKLGRHMRVFVEERMLAREGQGRRDESEMKTNTGQRLVTLAAPSNPLRGSQSDKSNILKRAKFV